MDVFDLAAKLTLDTSEYDRGIDNSETKANGFGKALGTAAKVGGAAMAAIGTATIAASTAMIKGAGDVAEYGDNIDKMSQKMGISAEAYQEWDAVMQHSGTSIDSLQRGMVTLSKQAEKGSDAFEQLGLTQEQVASMNQEELFAATIEGLQNMESGTERTALAQQLLGGSAKELGALLNTSAAETQAMKDRVHELGGVMSDEAVKAAAAYQDQLQDMKTAFSGLSRNMLSDFLPAITTTMSGLTQIFGGDTSGGLGLITEGIDGIVTKISDALPTVIQVGSNIVVALSTAISNNLPKLLSAGADAVTTIATGLVANFPKMVDSGINAIVSLADGIAKGLPRLIPQIVNVIVQIVNTLLKNVNKIVDSGIKIILGLVQGIIKALPQLAKSIPEIISTIIDVLIENIDAIVDAGIELLLALVDAIPVVIDALVEALPEIITAIVDGLVKAAPKILEAGIKLLMALVDAIPKVVITLVEALPQIITAIVKALSENIPKILKTGVELFESLVKSITQATPKIVKAVPGMIKAIVSAVKEGVSSLVSAGKNLVEGIWQGISGATGWIKDKIKGWVGDVTGFLKGLFGIHSPSTLMRDEIGKNLALGLWQGWEDNNPIDMINDDIDLVKTGITTSYRASNKTDYQQSIDYDALGLAVANGIAKSSLSVEIDKRDMGRIVREVVTYG